MAQGMGLGSTSLFRDSFYAIPPILSLSRIFSLLSRSPPRPPNNGNVNGLAHASPDPLVSKVEMLSTELGNVKASLSPLYSKLDQLLELLRNPRDPKHAASQQGTSRYCGASQAPEDCYYSYGSILFVLINPAAAQSSSRAAAQSSSHAAQSSSHATQSTSHAAQSSSRAATRFSSRAATQSSSHAATHFSSRSRTTSTTRTSPQSSARPRRGSRTRTHCFGGARSIVGSGMV
ncbi:hypothetical protein K438DRAFT_1932539 [Mycena galopus ATCC 62051]|nr:hypothetical protein K438DRAFT_1932539 [Mycena galopus ATCC 62051]